MPAVAVTWHTELEPALETARKAGRPVLLDFLSPH